MRKYSCGCRTCPEAEVPPGVAFTLSDPDSAARNGWFSAQNTRDGAHLVSPCLKHMPGVILRWATNKLKE